VLQQTGGRGSLRAVDASTVGKERLSPPVRMERPSALSARLDLGWPGLEGVARNPGASFANAQSSPGHPTLTFCIDKAVYRRRFEMSVGVPPSGGKDRLKPGLQQPAAA